jgi:hypothetical protein
VSNPRDGLQQKSRIAAVVGGLPRARPVGNGARRSIAHLADRKSCPYLKHRKRMATPIEGGTLTT